MNRRKGNAILIILSIVLAVALTMFLFWNRREEQRDMQRLAQEKMSDDLEDPAETEKDSETPQSEVVEQPEEIENHNGQTEVSSEDSGEEQLQNESVQKNEQIKGISFRGDSFCSEEEIDEKGFGANLKNILEQNGIELPVADYTMYEAGTLSQMRLAGVELSELDAYIEAHKSNLDEDELRITEVKVRDLSQEQLERDDQNYIPIICIGYYGGWGYDFEELCEQQQRILDTYQQQDKYLILGVYPTRCPDKDGYKEKMEQTWGEHYIMLDDVKKNSLSTDEGKEETAQIVYDKMMELGYLDGLQGEG